MKKIIIVITAITLLSLYYGCGKPTTPESVVPVEETGGYVTTSVYPTTGYAQDVYKKDDLLYIAQGEGGLIIIDVSDPAFPKTVSIISEGVRGYSTKITMKDTVAYLAAGSFGVSVVNVTDPENPIVTASNLGMKPARDILVMGDYMFTAISEQGVKIASVSYPTQPDIRGSITTVGYAHGTAATPDSNYLLVACGEMGLSIFNISEFDNGFGDYPQAGWADTPGYAEAVVLKNDEDIAFMACGSSGLQIVDFSDTTNIKIVGSFDGSGYAKELMYQNDLVYVAAEKGGMQVYDVADLTDPLFVGWVSTEYALGLTADEKYIYVADEVDGLYVIAKPE